MSRTEPRWDRTRASSKLRSLANLPDSHPAGLIPLWEPALSIRGSRSRLGYIVRRDSNHSRRRAKFPSAVPIEPGISPRPRIERSAPSLPLSRPAAVFSARTSRVFSSISSRLRLLQPATLAGGTFDITDYRSGRQGYHSKILSNCCHTSAVTRARPEPPGARTAHSVAIRTVEPRPEASGSLRLSIQALSWLLLSSGIAPRTLVCLSIHALSWLLLPTCRTSAVMHARPGPQAAHAVLLLAAP
jgi:hypothetical protein